MRARPAFTLIEMLLVVAIIVITTALIVPITLEMIDDARMTSAGDVIRARVADARAYALESGRPWRLAYLPNTGVFQLAPEDSMEWANTNQDPVEQDDLMRGSLPKDVLFAINRDDLLGSSDPGTPGGSWQTIGIYSFDGSARDDSTTYFGRPGIMPMRARLRGLTGSVIIDSSADVKADQP